MPVVRWRRVRAASAATALLVITDSAGNVSRVERIRFRVLRRRR